MTLPLSGRIQRRAAGSFTPPVAVDRDRENPLHRQLYAWIRSAILNGQMRPGQRMPSTRNLASELGLSRIPVLNAYEQLLAEGYLETLTGAGTFVAHSLPEHCMQATARKTPARAEPYMEGAARHVSRRAKALAATPSDHGLNNMGAFRVSLPAVDRLPMNVWAKLVARHGQHPQLETLTYSSALGHLPFREAIAEYLGASRAVRCDASQVLITTGSQQALHLCAQVLLDPGERMCMEEPGYPGARKAFLAAGLEVLPISVDDEGLEVDRISHRRPAPHALYITPSHQYPTGVTMSAARRMKLLDWAAANGTWIIEDDYDSEYRFGSRPVGSLQGMDRDHRVIYVGTFSKVLFPALRVGYMVVPLDLVPAFSAARNVADVFSPTLYQLVLTDFIREGHFARHIRRMRMLYMQRRAALVEALESEMPRVFEVMGAAAGMHLVGLLPAGVDDVAIARAAATAGISTIPLSSCYMRKPARGGLILGYGGVDEDGIREGVRRLRACM
jgi:GntR family transcriptional regulator/MocR family aminotransferase